MPHTNIGVPSTIQDSTQINRAKETIDLLTENQNLKEEIKKLKSELMRLLKGE
jgi:hypothetical protein